MVNVKVMLNLIKDEQEDAYIPNKNSKLGSQKAKLKRERR